MASLSWSELLDKIQTQLFVLLFAAVKPVSRLLLAKICQTDPANLKPQLQQVAKQAKNLGLELIEHDGAYRLATQPVFAQSIQQLQINQAESLSSASLEVLAIIAYRQPITRGQIDEIRGVGSEQTIKALLTRKLISQQAKKHDHQPTYGTTADLLSHLGLDHISKLPRLTTNA